MAARTELVLLRQHEFARRLADHPFDQVDAEDFFGDRMLDLKPRVHLEEIGFLAVDVIEEFHRAGGFVFDGLAERDRGVAQSRPHAHR